MLPSATIGGSVNLYEPVHGSAPDIAGKGIANPLGAILTAAMVLRHSANLEQDAQAVELAVRKVLEQGYRTADLLRAGQGGHHVTTQEMGSAVHQTLNEIIDRRQALHAV
jgi:3-isopropylmalate dehydrogenase